MSITVPQMFEQMAEHYNPGVLTAPRSYYFSVGPHKYTVEMTPEGCTVNPGKTNDRCDCVLKTTEKIFSNMVLEGARPGALDVARGRFKTNNVPALMELKELFTFEAP